MPKIAVPQELCCPITGLIIEDPVIASDGYTYEKDAIQERITTHGTSPITDEKINEKFIANQSKVAQIDKFYKENKICTHKEFWDAVAKGDVTEIEKLNYIDIQIELCNESDTRPLHIAVSNKHVEMVEWLLKNGANVEVKTIDGFTAMHHILSQHPTLEFFKTKAIVDLLIQYKANIDAQSKDGSTPLHRAAQNYRANIIVNLLLTKGADIRILDKHGKTPLEIAKGQKNVQLLTDCPGDNWKLNQQNTRVSQYFGVTKVSLFAATDKQIWSDIEIKIASPTEQKTNKSERQEPKGPKQS